MIAASFRSNDVITIVNSAHATSKEDCQMESTGVKLGREVSRRRLQNERPRFKENGERVLRGQKGPGSDEEETTAKARVPEIRRSKSLHAKAGGGGKTPDGQRERTLLSWHLSKSQGKKKEAERSDGIEIPTPIEVSTSIDSLVFPAHGQESIQLPADTRNVGTSDNSFIQRLVSVIGDISCPIHPDRSIQSCPRECSWHIEHHVERGKSSTDEIEKAFVNRSDSSTLVPSSSVTDSTRSIFNDTHVIPTRYPFRVRPCYILIFLGFLSIVGSLAPALWRANIQDDLSGGFTLAQYILGVGIFVVGSMVAIHSRTCVCWHT